ncbi:alanine racemase [Gammaproteobacteria bacterium]|nr:alanine racemase [Gammaproteobacteria bacterium]MDA9195829.1 alanine racemase [Gammaproteobacteria bacterium]MDB4829194.1 alanine racemase [Gammaproteobacteria bacterium]|tara:strand:+ start:6278 stop:7333 length:1056 start_codon:yes stop_codon:yes gene_type:complete
MTSLRSELIIDPTIVQENINYLKKLIPVGSKFMAVIKSDAYGHIMENLLEHIDDFVDGYGTVRIDEAIRIREASNKKILLMTGVYSEEDLKIASKYDFDLVVHNSEQFDLIKRNNFYKNLWFKINTGMNRLGFEENEFLKIYEEHLKDKKIVLMSHLAASNDPKKHSNKEQFARFNNVYSQLSEEVSRSIANTGCVFNYPDHSYDWVRCGIGMFGGYIGTNELKTAMTLRSPIVNIRKIKKGESVGYDGRATANQDMTVATVYIGYADGLAQNIKDGTIVLVNGKKAKIFGKVSMDLTTVDISDHKACNVGDFCEIFSPKSNINNISIPNDLISYDLMIRIKSRVKKTYHN